MTVLERMGLAVVGPRRALAIAGDRRHAGRSGTDLLVAIIAVLLATQLRGLVGAAWLGVTIAGSLGVRALFQVLTDAVVVELVILVIAAGLIYVASGARRELGRAFDLACVAALPLLLVDLVATTVVTAAELDVPRAVMWVLSLGSYVWVAVLVGLAILEARHAEPRPAGDSRRARRAGWALAGIVLAGVVVQVVWLARHVDRVRPMSSGDPAPQFALPKITGKDTLGEAVSLVPGKITVLDFWATWCNPCLKSMPHLDAFARRHPEVAVYAINIDDPGEAWAIFDERKYAMTLLAGDHDTTDRYGVSAIPHTVLIDREGRVRRVFRGGSVDLEREVQALAK